MLTHSDSDNATNAAAIIAEHTASIAESIAAIRCDAAIIRGCGVPDGRCEQFAARWQRRADYFAGYVVSADDETAEMRVQAARFASGCRDMAQRVAEAASEAGEAMAREIEAE